MNFNNHYNLEGLHAPFSASQSAWLRYTDDKLLEVFNNKQLAERGTRLHAFAKEAIDLGINLPKNQKTLNMYVNDAIGYGLSTEVVLYYSDYFFGTADAIKYDEKKKVLRIHDLKTGIGTVHKEQLEVYAALFCLEYRVKPEDISFVLRIYQNDNCDEWNPTSEKIRSVMDKITLFNKLLFKYNKED